MEKVPLCYLMEGRIKEGEKKTCVAVFPKTPANPGNYECYVHLGQHSEGQIKYFHRLREATLEEQKDLHRELSGIYRGDCELVVITKKQLLKKDYK